MDNRLTFEGGTGVNYRHRGRGPVWLAIGILLFAAVPGCKQDESPLKAENEGLRKQLAKQESLFTSLQEGNKVMQQQIDLLNRELRDAKKEAEKAQGDLQQTAAQLETQLAQTKRLSAEVQKTSALQSQTAQSLRIDDKGAQGEELPRALGTVAKAVEEALSRNGYQVKVSVKTDQKAVYVTERKVSNPASLEVTGFRNQYLVSLQSIAPSVTRLNVKAEFEKLAQGGRILSVSAEETAEIERRLIGEIGKALAAPSKT